MTGYIAKLIVSALVIVAASELGKRSSVAGAILISLPLSSILAMSWLWAETKDAAKVSSMSTWIFWAVIPSLLLFLILPALLKRGWSYWPALGAACAATAAGYAAFAAALSRFGVAL